MWQKSQLPTFEPLGKKQEPSNPKSNVMDDTMELLAESLLYYPRDVPVFALGLDNIQIHEQQDPILLALLQQGIYTEQELHGTTLICNLPGDQQKIVLPEILQEPTIKWSHMVMAHGGATRIYKAIGQFFFSPRLKAQLEQLVLTCDVCQRNKSLGQ